MWQPRLQKVSATSPPAPQVLKQCAHYYFGGGLAHLLKPEETISSVQLLPALPRLGRCLRSVWWMFRPLTAAATTTPTAATATISAGDADERRCLRACSTAHASPASPISTLKRLLGPSNRVRECWRPRARGRPGNMQSCVIITGCLIKWDFPLPIVLRTASAIPRLTAVPSRRVPVKRKSLCIENHSPPSFTGSSLAQVRKESREVQTAEVETYFIAARLFLISSKR